MDLNKLWHALHFLLTGTRGRSMTGPVRRSSAGRRSARTAATDRHAFSTGKWSAWSPPPASCWSTGRSGYGAPRRRQLRAGASAPARSSVRVTAGPARPGSRGGPMPTGRRGSAARPRR
ncbi:hypothetical protein [Micromonospora sp. NPDC050200]|uniref:hypothetical protein n=1 Tax=Micromonospora sp. NPDC050200 TaxID=3155664 RepID=UPI0033CBDCF3